MATNTNTLKTRVQLKSDTEANWNKAGPKEGSSGFVPLLGELIVYIPDEAHHFSRLKVGDGSTNVVNLPFIDAGTIDGESLPENEIYTYSNRAEFPSPGIINKLYIDLSTNTIYCFNNSSGYSQLSNFTYTTQKTDVSVITEWRVGAITTLSSDKGILYAKNGILPKLSYYNTSVVSGITKEDNV